MERRKLVHWRDLFFDLMARDLQIRYRRSRLGQLWSVLNPLVLLIMCMFLFQNVLNLRIQNYPLFLFCAILPWSWFAATLAWAPGAVVDNRNLVRKPYFPAQVLPIVTTLSALIRCLFTLPLLVILLLAFHAPFALPVLILPLIVGIQFLLSTGMAFLIAIANVRFRDVQHVVSALLIVSFFLTPIFYDLAAVPDQLKGAYMLNPLTHLIGAYREILLYARLPNMLAVAVLLLISLAIFIGGYNLFVSQRQRFIEEL